ncbi:MAG TPA: DUF2157 domain-containing protein [Candidatus Acidoferrum sp.]|nr:DUF2157 domain-containing protein [Candidatus Acidoferrum sp.]
MPANLEAQLQRWVSAGVVDAATADRLRDFEAQHSGSQKLRWPIILALSFGGLLLAAGVLLFVAAHWDELSPSKRFALVLLLVALFHAAGAAAAGRFTALSRVLHAVGTATLGAGIFLAGQIFNLEEHWPGGIMLWAIGAALAWWILRDWIQGLLVALLVPAWLAGEWIVATENFVGGERILAEGLLLLAITYLTGSIAERRHPLRRALVVVGAIALIPSVPFAIESASDFYRWRHEPVVPLGLAALGWTLAFGLPLLLAVFLRGRAAALNLLAALWVWLLGTTGSNAEGGQLPILQFAWHELGPYFLCGLGSVGLIAWGLRESRKERINLGIAGFALTVLVFYFSDVMDKLGRSEGLIGLGVLFLFVGWLLEKTRRRLVARLGGQA